MIGAFQVGAFQTDYQQLAVVINRGGSSHKRKGRRPPYWWETTREEEAEITAMPVIPAFVAPPGIVPSSREIVTPRIAFTATPVLPDLEAEKKRRNRRIAMAIAERMWDEFDE